MLRRDRERHIDRAVVLSEAFTQSADRARRDVLTGLRNRLAWEEAIAHHSARQAPVGVVLADVDGLKATNDALGHDAGDRLLVAIARIIAEATPADAPAMAARLGGDEFGILLPGALAGRTVRIAEALQRALSGATGTSDGPAVSASIGYGVARNGSAVASAFVEADRGVYDDKATRSTRRR
jgi:diguanylate cyclase (GGDEF)-like protein